MTTEARTCARERVCRGACVRLWVCTCTAELWEESGPSGAPACTGVDAALDGVSATNSGFPTPSEGAESPQLRALGAAPSPAQGRRLGNAVWSH